MLYVSFPRKPNVFPRNPHWHAQISYHVFKGLQARFGKERVEFIKWGKRAPVGHGDLLITFLRNINYLNTTRIIGVENDTLIPERWTSATFNCFGEQVPVDDNSHLLPILKNPAGYCVLTNDVALTKLKSGDSKTVEHVENWRSFVDGNYAVCTHPIDKAVFQRSPKRDFNRNGRWSQHRMLVYHRDWRKSSQATINLLKEMGYQQGREYSVVGWVNKSNRISMANLARKFNIIFSGSFSETGPANMLEFLTQGYLVAGHEDWWTGHGVPQTVWSYDPARKDEMSENMAYLLDDANVPELQDHRDNINARWMGRKDNEWSYFCDKLSGVIKTALAN